VTKRDRNARFLLPRNCFSVYRTAPFAHNLGTRNSAATNGHLRCHGRMMICVPAWRFIFHAR
jgi:hypothetical protein